MPPRRSVSGVALLAVLPWAIAAVGFTVAVTSWVSGPADQRPAGRTVPADGDTLRELRSALATASAENASLRGELDRLVGRGSPRGAAPAGAPAAADGDAASPMADPAASELSERISETLSRAAVGDQESAKEGAMALLQALQQGPEAVAALRDAYLSTGDPKARMMILPTLLFGGGEEARDFVVEQASTETDPELRKALLTQAAGFATPRHAGELQDTFLEVLDDPEADPTLRVAALRGLRYGRGPEVQESLLAALSDTSEDARLAAIESLASRPGARKKLGDLLAQDPSPRVREVGECRLLLAEHVR